MQLNIDTGREPLADVLRVIGAAYNVNLVEDSAGPTPAPRRESPKRSGRGTRQRSGNRAAPADVRKWAAENGFEVNTRGAIPKSINEAYASANG